MNRRGRLALLGALLSVGIWFLWRVRRLFTPLFLSIVLAYLLLPWVRRIEARGASRTVAILLVYATLAVVVGTLVSVLMPYLSLEIESLLAALPDQTSRLEERSLHWLRELRRMGNLPEAVRGGIGTLLARAEQVAAGALARLGSLLMTLFTSLFYLILTPILAYFFMRDWQAICKAFLGWFPPCYHGEVMQLARRVDRVLAGFIRGQLLVSLIIGLLIAAGLALLKVRYALVVGMIAGAFNVIPYFGPILGAIPAVGLALLTSPSAALWTILLFIAVNQLDGALLSPKVVGDLVGLHPATVILTVLAGAEIGGIAGMLVAVPAAAVLKVSGEFFYEWFVRQEPKDGFEP